MDRLLAMMMMRRRRRRRRKPTMIKQVKMTMLMT
jgi:hypothetical protein